MVVASSPGPQRLTVEPGSSTVFDVTLRNEGAVTETVQLRVTGPGGPFSFVVPETLSIEPGSEAEARVGFRVPRTSVPGAGPLAFEVVATGEADVTVVEGIVEVERFCVLSATLDPSEAAVTGTSRHQLTVGNRGNAPVQIDLVATDADGLDVRMEPRRVTASPDQSATAIVEVTPRRRPFTGAERSTSFAIVATPDCGDPIDVRARLRQRPVVATRTLVTSATVVGAVVIALVLGLTALSDGSSSTSSPSAATDQTVDTGVPSADCPAAGHRDVGGVSGLRPDDIPRLPNTYSFLHLTGDGCRPVRFNPCEPIHYVQNLTLAPPTGEADVREAFNLLSKETGMTFVDDGITDETFRRGGYLPDRYPGRWAPILVNWQRFPARGSDPAIQAVGGGIGTRVGDMLVSGVLMLNVDAVTNDETRAPVQGGFGPPIGSGTGAIGPEGVTWGRIILHELAHVIGLGHTRDKGAIMYPESAEQTARPAEFKEPDRAGLRFLGREAGCLTTPPLPAS
jgi:hypothetical protein